MSEGRINPRKGANRCDELFLFIFFTSSQEDVLNFVLCRGGSRFENMFRFAPSRSCLLFEFCLDLRLR